MGSFIKTYRVNVTDVQSTEDEQNEFVCVCVCLFLIVSCMKEIHISSLGVFAVVVAFNFVNHLYFKSMVLLYQIMIAVGIQPSAKRTQYNQGLYNVTGSLYYGTKQKLCSKGGSSLSRRPQLHPHFLPQALRWAGCCWAHRRPCGWATRWPLANLKTDWRGQGHDDPTPNSLVLSPLRGQKPPLLTGY